MKRLFSIIFLVSIVCDVYSAVVKGKVEDGSRRPVAYANIVALSAADSTYISGAVSDSLGLFMMSVPDTGVVVKISCIGYETLTATPDGKFMVLTLKESAGWLGEVSVKARRPEHTLTSEGIMTSVEGTMLEKLGTAEDVLRHVPGISKKGEGWEIFGKGSPVIYINNRPIYSLTELDNLQSADIRSVEVIRSPGAKNAATVNAVIRIRTKKRKGEGLSGMARAKYFRNRYDGTVDQLDLNWQHGGISTFMTYKYGNFKSIQDARFVQEVSVDTLWRQESDNYDVSKTEYHYLTGGMAYDWGKDNSSSAGIRYSAYIPCRGYSKGSFDSFVYADGNAYDRLSTSSIDKTDNSPTHQLNAYCLTKAGATEIDLNADLYFSHGSGTGEYYEESASHDSRQLHSTSESHSSMAAAKLLFATPVLGGRLSYGAEFSSTQSRESYAMDRSDIVAPTQSKIREYSAAPFAEYSHSIGKSSSLTLGLRYENVRFRYYENGEYVPGQSRTFSDFFPSLVANTKTGPVAWQLTYVAKTSRPSYSQLSNSVSYSNRFTRQSGNPLLTRQTTHSVSLVGVWKCMQLIAGYDDTRHAIINWAEQMPGEESVTLMSYRNIRSIKTLQTFISATPTIGVWSPQASAGMLKQFLRLKTLGAVRSFNRPVFVASLNNMFRFKGDLSFNVDFSYQSRGNVQNAEITKEQFILNVGASKSFFNDALTVSLQGWDLLYKTWEGNLLYNDRMTFRQTCRRGARKLIVDVKYNFNAFKSRYRGTGAGNSEKDRL